MLNNSTRVLVVGNYLADQQQSMIRFADLLVRIYQPQAEVRLIYPPVLFSRLPGLSAVARKYFAYIDKLLVFPAFLLFRALTVDLVHIADHGNAYYTFFCKPSQCIVTCHDLLMMRAVRGDDTVACYPSGFGFLLQRLILAGLRRSRAVTFVSQATFGDYQRLGGGPRGQRNAVIPNTLNAPFSPAASEFSLSAKEHSQLPQEPFLLMVGSSHPRKNRSLALQLLNRLGASSPYSIVFAGDPLVLSEQSFCDTHLLGNRVLSIVRPSHSLLNTLYCKAHALLFPSVSEGFGWPLIEAQACGCPVIASLTSSIPEVAGKAALYCDPHDVIAFACHVQSLEDPALRSRMIRLGFENSSRFDADVVSDACLRFAFQL